VTQTKRLSRRLSQFALATFSFSLAAAPALASSACAATMTSHSFLCSFHAATWQSLGTRWHATPRTHASSHLLQYHSSLHRLQRFSAGLPHALCGNISQLNGNADEKNTSHLHFGSSMNSSKLFWP
jgi:hypothetical protein